MASNCGRWVALREELTIGVYDATGTDILMRLDSGNAAQMDVNPAYNSIRTADACNEPILEIGGRKPIAGSIDQYLFADGTAPDDWAGRILNLGFGVVDGVLPSFSYTEFDGIRYQRFLGCMFGDMRLSSAAEPNEGGVRIRGSMVGTTIAADPTPTDPVLADYPTRIYRHQESGGGLIFRTSGSAVRTTYRSFEVGTRNDVVVSFDESDQASDITWNGRQIDGSFEIRFTSKTDRDNFISRANHVASIVFTKSSTTPKHRVAIDLQTAVKITGLDRNRPLGQRQYETLRFMSYLDPATGQSIAITTSNPA